MDRIITRDKTNQLIQFTLESGYGLPCTGIVDTNLVCNYFQSGDGSATAVALTPGTIGAYAPGTFVEVDATNLPGLYEFGIPDNALANARNAVTFKFISIGGPGFLTKTIEIELVYWDTETPVQANVTQWNAHAVHDDVFSGYPDITLTYNSAGSACTFTGGDLNVNVSRWYDGTPVVAPAVSGVPYVTPYGTTDVNVATWAGQTVTAPYTGQGTPMVVNYPLWMGGIQGTNLTTTVELNNAGTIPSGGAPSSVSNFYKGMKLIATSGTGAGQERIIVQYDPGPSPFPNNVTVDRPFSPAIDMTTTFAIEYANTNLATAQAIVPGDTNGLLISGTNSGTTTFGSIIAGSWTVSGSTVFLGSVSMGSTLNITSAFTMNALTVNNGVTFASTIGAGLTVSSSSTSAINAFSTATNGAGMVLTGAGTTSGLRCIGGATGAGIFAKGGSTSGAGLELTSFGGNGITVLALGASKHGIQITGGNSGTSDGINITAGSGGVGVRADTITTSGTVTFNAFTISNAFTVSGTTTHTGAVSFGSTFGVTGTVTLNALTVTNALLVSGTTTLTGAVACSSTFTVSGLVNFAASFTVNGSTSLLGAAVGAGLIISSSSGAGVNITSSGGDAVRAISAFATGVGLRASGGTSGAGASFTGGSSGPGLKLTGGSASGAGLSVVTTSGNGLDIAPTAGHGVNIAANGSSKHGLFVTGGTAGTSDGINAVAGTGGVDIRGNLTGNITGTLSGNVNLAADQSAVTIGTVNDVVGAVTIDGTSPLTEAYAAAGSGFTLSQALYEICQSLTEVSIAGTTITFRKRDKVTTAGTFTINDASNPTSRTRST